MKEKIIKSNLKSRLDLIIKELGFSGRQFEKHCELPNGSYSSIRDGVGADKLKDILIKFPQINVNWLLTGMGEMFIDSEEKPSVDLLRVLELKQDNVDLLLEQNRREREYTQTILSIAEQLLDMVERGETINVKEFRARLKLVA